MYKSRRHKASSQGVRKQNLGEAGVLGDELAIALPKGRAQRRAPAHTPHLTHDARRTGASDSHLHPPASELAFELPELCAKEACATASHGLRASRGEREEEASARVRAAPAHAPLGLVMPVVGSRVVDAGLPLAAPCHVQHATHRTTDLNTRPTKQQAREHTNGIQLPAQRQRHTAAGAAGNGTHLLRTTPPAASTHLTVCLLPSSPVLVCIPMFPLHKSPCNTDGFTCTPCTKHGTRRA